MLTSRLKYVLFALLLSALLILLIPHQSLWTDEAFSAFIASHRTFSSAWQTLKAGDSSDLQMVLYYLFLHAWTNIFGQSEIAFRTEHIPFILLFSCVLVWLSRRLFASDWIWIIGALTPLAVAFSSDTRPYFDVIALSLTCLACLLVYLEKPGPRERKFLPWIVLLSLLIGAGFHMLMILLGAPLLVLLAILHRFGRVDLRWADWKKPLFLLVPAGLAMGGYFAWTFARGTSYDYDKPSVPFMISALIHWAGFSGYEPNRRFDNPFSPYLPAMLLAGLLFGAGIVLLFRIKRKSRAAAVFYALLGALVTGVAEFFALSFLAHEQIEFRHLSSLLPLLIVFIMAGLHEQGQPRLVALAAAAIGLTWFVSDVRYLTGPEYAREDFRASIQRALELRNATHADIAVAADPAAAAYYGLDLDDAGAKCFPLVNSCQQGFAKVPWPKIAPAKYAMFWSSAQIRAWLQSERENHTPVVLVISHSRHPMLTNCPWWPVLRQSPNTQLFPEHGFFVYLIR